MRRERLASRIGVREREMMAKNKDRSGTFTKWRETLRQLLETIKRAFIEFLTVPTLVIAGFLLLAWGMFVLDDIRIAEDGSDRRTMWGGLFSDAQAARDFLGVIAASIITVTSITFSLLLIAVQQGAAALTSQVFDQFLRRRANQLYFGFFIGLALYALIMLASVNPSHQPIYGVAVAGVMAVAALYILILLIYTTIDQMRPVVIIRSIHDHTLLARENQLDLLRSTRRAAKLQGPPRVRVAAERSGFLARLNVATMVTAIGDSESEVVVLVSIGDYVSYGDFIAEIRTAADNQAVSAMEDAVLRSVALEERRDLDGDPAFGVEQLVTIGWTSISTAKSNPGPGLLTIQNLRDLLARWLQADAAFGTRDAVDTDSEACVVYFDNLPEKVMRGFESFAVVASESMQHQSAAEIYRMLAGIFPRLPPQLERQVNDLLCRSLAGLGDHILTNDLEESLSELIDALTQAGQVSCSAAITAARYQLSLSIGRLNSRSTRTKASADHHSSASD